MKYNLVGQRFGRLLVIEETKERKVGNLREWTCLCDCGKTTSTLTASLMRGATTSCGCYHIERLATDKLTHGQSKNGKRTAEYGIWSGLKSRCYNPNREDYIRYGGRGIIVCERWLNSFDNFFEDMGARPTKNHSLDRFPNNENGIYEKSNCRWATSAEQARGRRQNKWYEYNGIIKVLQDWAVELNISPETIKFHSDKKGTNFSEQFNKLKAIGDKNRSKGFYGYLNRKEKYLK